MLIGVTYALLDLVEKHQFKLNNTIVMETGGMKGKRREMIREELHKILCKGFGVDSSIFNSTIVLKFNKLKESINLVTCAISKL